MANNNQIVLSVDGIEHDNTEGGITLKSAFKFLRIAALRVLIYVLVAAIAATVLVAIIDAVAPRDNFASVNLELVYPHAAQGFLPGGTGSFEPNMIIDTAILNQAASNKGFREESGTFTHDIQNINNLRAHFSVTSINTQEYIELRQRLHNNPEDTEAQLLLATGRFAPTRFTIRLNDPRDLGLSNAEATALVAEVRNVFTEQFVERYFSAISFNTNMFNVSVQPYNSYIMHSLNFNHSLNYIMSFLNQQRVENPTFMLNRGVGDNLSFNGLLSTATQIQLSLAAFRSTVIINSITQDRATDLRILEEHRNSLLGEIVSYEERRETTRRNMQGTLGQYGVPSDGGELIVITPGNPTEHARLIREDQMLTERITMLQREANDVEDILYTFANGVTIENPVTREQALVILNSIADRLTTLIQDTNALLEHYFTINTQANTIHNIGGAAIFSARRIDTTIYVLIVVAVALIAALAALIVTNKKRTQWQLKKAAAETEAQITKPVTTEEE